MKEILLPALSDAQKYFVARVLTEEGRMAWDQAKVASERVPGVVYRTDDPELIQRIVAGLENHEIIAEVQEAKVEGFPWGRSTVDAGSSQETEIAPGDLAAPAVATRPSAMSYPRIFAGIGCVVLLALLFLWTEGLATEQQSGPQILQVLLSALHGRDIAPCRQRDALNSEVGNRKSPRICL